MKCPECGFENGDSKFCGECGAKLPREKQCPECGFMTVPTFKFCPECGHRFGGNAPAAPAAGVSMGDKNVIAGDVIGGASQAGASDGGISMGDKNVIAGDVIGKKLVVEKGATLIHNEDETRKLVQCHICGRKHAISESIECPRCGDTVCENCYDRSLLLCSNCKEKEFRVIEQKVADGEIFSLTQGNEEMRNLLMKALKEKFGIKIQGTILQEYKGNDRTKEFSIPSGITEIAGRAFSGSGIVSVEIPSTVKCIHDSAFLKCPNLQKVVLNEGLESIGEYAFQGCEKLSEIVIPGSVKKIEKYAFSKCPNLQKAILNEGLESIGEDAFWECGRLAEIIVPGSVKTIGKYAFCDCPNLQTVILNEGLESIGEKAFFRCKNLLEIVIPGSVKAIEEYAFRECICMKKAIMNEGLDLIGEHAFSICESLSEVYIPASVKKIYPDAFFACNKLIILNIPPATELIGSIFRGTITRKELVAPGQAVCHVCGRKVNVSDAIVCSRCKKTVCEENCFDWGSRLCSNCKAMKARTTSGDALSAERTKLLTVLSHKAHEAR